MTENHDCDKCNRIDKWLEHSGCTPTILEKYKILLNFVREIKDGGCSLIEGIDCKACRALDVLRQIGEA